MGYYSRQRVDEILKGAEAEGLDKAEVLQAMVDRGDTIEGLDMSADTPNQAGAQAFNNTQEEPGMLGFIGDRLAKSGAGLARAAKGAVDMAGYVGENIMTGFKADPRKADQAFKDMGMGVADAVGVGGAVRTGRDIVNNTMQVAAPLAEKTLHGAGRMASGMVKSAQFLGDNLQNGFKTDPRKGDEAVSDFLYGGAEMFANGVATAMSPIAGTVATLPEDAQKPIRAIGEGYLAIRDFLPKITGNEDTDLGNGFKDAFDMISSVTGIPGAAQLSKVAKAGVVKGVAKAAPVLKEAIGTAAEGGALLTKAALSKLNIEGRMIQKPIRLLEKATGKIARDENISYKQMQVAQEIFGDSARKTTAIHLPRIEKAAKEVLETVSNEINTKGMKNVDVSARMMKLNDLKVGFYDDLAKNMNTPVIRKNSLEFIDRIDDGFAHPGNQTQGMAKLRGIMRSVEKDNTLRGSVASIKQLDELIADTSMATQREFMVQLKGELMKDIDLSVSTVSHDAGNMLASVDELTNNFRDVIDGKIQEDVARNVARGIPEADAWMAALPDSENILHHLPAETAEKVQRAVFQKAMTRANMGGSLNLKVLHDEMRNALKSPQVLTQGSLHTLRMSDKLFGAAEKGLDMVSEYIRNRKVKANDEAMWTDAYNNPTVENIQRVANYPLTPQDAASMIQQKKTGNFVEMKKQQMMAKSNAGALTSDMRPEMVTGQKVIDVTNDLLGKKDMLGQEKDKLITANANKKIDIGNVKRELTKDIEDKGVVINKDGEMDFSKSEFADDTVTQGFIQKIMRDVNEGSLSVKDANIVRNRTRNNMNGAKGITGVAPEFVKTFGDKQRAMLSAKLETAIPGYREINKQYAQIVEAVHKFSKSVGIEYSIDELNGKNLRAGEVANRLGGNASGATWDKLKPLFDLYEEINGVNLAPQVQSLVGNKSLLQRFYGDPQKENLSGQVEKGTRGENMIGGGGVNAEIINRGVKFAKGKRNSPKDTFETGMRVLDTLK